MNSPWGKIFNIIKETPFTWNYILWKISWINVQMMLADAPRYSAGKSKKGAELESEDDFKDFLKL